MKKSTTAKLALAVMMGLGAQFVQPMGWQADQPVLAWQSAAAMEAVDYNNGTITVQGMGVAPQNAVNAAQAKMLARRAAVVDAYRQLAESVKGVNVDAETTVENMMTTSDVIKTHVSAMIQGARVVDEKVIDGMGYQVTMQVSMFGVTGSVASAVLQKPAAVEPFPKPVENVAPAAPVTPSGSVQVNVTVNQPTAQAPTTQAPAVQTPAPAVQTPAPAVQAPTVQTPSVQAPTVQTPAVQAPAPAVPQASVPSGSAVGGFTGLIVDCRGLGLKPVMSPVIKNANGEAIYGAKNLDYDKVVKQGMAGYTSDMTRAARAGAHPLVVKAVALENHNGNPVLSVADANRVLIENTATGFLENTSVVFVR